MGWAAMIKKEARTQAMAKIIVDPKVKRKNPMANQNDH
jgi:hypothetical protein